MSKHSWNSSNIPSLKGKTVIITGASSGLGKEATKVLSEKDAKVIMAVRNSEKAKKVADQIRKEVPSANIEIRTLDLGSLDSVKAFAKEVNQDLGQLDILINNAGVMMCPYSTTKDGFEIQMGTNHLGHFALTGLLMPLLKRSKDSRVVVTSSIAHKSGNIDFEDLNWETRKYNTTKAYSDSKLANLYFMYELVNRLGTGNDAPKITCAHPGWTKTDLDRHSSVINFIGNIVAQKVHMGTLPTLRAATDEAAVSGNYFGPKGMMEMRGHPVLVKSNEMANNQGNAKSLWDLSEQLTGVNY
ncbi:MAG: NAD(P)-dependent dehydrogenase (short-subunit alcohol dehydrogenase family) [Flavobacteriales bacterium]|jgi:NAD(P)-dependent dehydrogenase (short-subunit alcohol dehydrogenase family)